MYNEERTHLRATEKKPGIVSEEANTVRCPRVCLNGTVLVQSNEVPHDDAPVCSSRDHLVFASCEGWMAEQLRILYEYVEMTDYTKM